MSLKACRVEKRVGKEDNSHEEDASVDDGYGFGWVLPRLSGSGLNYRDARDYHVPSGGRDRGGPHNSSHYRPTSAERWPVDTVAHRSGGAGHRCADVHYFQARQVTRHTSPASVSPVLCGMHSPAQGGASSS